MSLAPAKVSELEKKAAEIRQSVIEMLIEAGSGHTAGSLDMADIFTYLYFYALKHDPKNPAWPYRDRLILSNGHICPVLYASLAHAGYFDIGELKTLRKIGSRLQGHPHREWLPIPETSSGPLGSGLSQAVGMAIAERMDSSLSSSKKFYCIMSDGELDEGNTWEAIMLAGKEKLNNLIAIVDRNNIQISGYTDDVMPLNPLKDKWKAFNWQVIEIDGHNFTEIDRAVETAKMKSDKPTVIIARTIASKGIPEYEGRFEWHGKVPGNTGSLSSGRTGFAEGLVITAEMNKQIVGLSADLAESTGMLPFKEKFPERYIEVGVAEQNLATVASGMAAMGKIPFMASFAVFSPGRNWEQIRTTICYNNLPVKIIGSHAGLNVGPDGGSHQALEDIAMMRSLPRMVVVSPCDAIEAKKAAIAISKTEDPTYIRLSREKSPIITAEDTPFEIGKATIVFTRSDLGGQTSVGIIATGSIISRAVNVAMKLSESGINVTVMNLSTIKPLDEVAIIKLAHDTGAIVTVEEHQVAGGMGSAVAECLASHFPVPIEFIGVKDQFGQSGNAEELLDLYGLGEKDIFEAAKRVMLRK